MAGGVWFRVIMSVTLERDWVWTVEKGYLKKKNSKSEILLCVCVCVCVCRLNVLTVIS